MRICDSCHNQFEGKHTAWCKDCNKPHPICDACYEHQMNLGGLVKQKVNIKDISEQNMVKYT